MQLEYYAHSKDDKPTKEWQKLDEHLKNVAELAKQFAEPFGGGDWAELITRMVGFCRYKRRNT
ncbi:MAG: hypothetical protein AAB019_09465 [Planctomycetota bacterium]